MIIILLQTISTAQCASYRLSRFHLVNFSHKLYLVQSPFFLRTLVHSKIFNGKEMFTKERLKTPPYVPTEYREK